MSRRVWRVLASIAVPMLSLACGPASNEIRIEFDDDIPTFTAEAPAWTWNMQPVRINAMAVASGSEALWEIRTLTPEGVQAAGLAIRYGELPDEFEQITPPNNGRAKDLWPGETYFVGATGPDDNAWRAVFALPVGPFGVPPRPELPEDEEPVKADVSNPQPPASPAE